MFRTMLCYIYTDDAPPAAMVGCNSRQEEGGDDGCDFSKAWELLMVADRYGVDRLKTEVDLRARSLQEA